MYPTGEGHSRLYGIETVVFMYIHAGIDRMKSGYHEVCDRFRSVVNGIVSIGNAISDLVLEITCDTESGYNCISGDANDYK